MKKWSAIALLLLLLLLLLLVLVKTVLVAYGTKDAADSEKIGASDTKILNMGTSADYLPFEYVETAVSDEIVGFDIDLAKIHFDELIYYFNEGICDWCNRYYEKIVYRMRQYLSLFWIIDLRRCYLLSDADHSHN